ncbi:MAG: hypothetical protein JOY64_20700 [Alphaproteobacteria bacterium]|nr:hypothetical protein [Alphaproteobacteria bacterium]MBV8410060.1 hypothetical protein [Alphaproteobacteria bacterium]
MTTEAEATRRRAAAGRGTCRRAAARRGDRPDRRRGAQCRRVWRLVSTTATGASGNKLPVPYGPRAMGIVVLTAA